MGQIVALKNQLDHSVATLAAGNVLFRLFSDLDKLNSATEFNEAWANDVFNIMLFSGAVETGFSHAKAYALAILKDHWDDMPIDVRKQYGFSFNKMAQNFTGKQSSTIDNYIRTARVWFINKVSPGKPIEITVRDNEKRPIRDEHGRVLTKFEEFNPYMVDMSKLLVVNARAARGEMTPKLWEMLVDPFYTYEDIQLEHANGDKEPDFYRPSYFLLGPGLYAEMAGKTLCIAEELNWSEYETDSDVKDAIDLLLKMLDVVPEEDRIHQLERESMK